MIAKGGVVALESRLIGSLRFGGAAPGEPLDHFLAQESWRRSGQLAFAGARLDLGVKKVDGRASYLRHVLDSFRLRCRAAQETDVPYGSLSRGSAGNGA
jgi:hypothetical protein